MEKRRVPLVTNFFIPVLNRPARNSALPLNASESASAAGRRPGDLLIRITGITMFRPTGSGAAGIPAIGVPIDANTFSRSFKIGINSVDVIESDG